MNEYDIVIFMVLKIKTVSKKYMFVQLKRYKIRIM